MPRLGPSPRAPLSLVLVGLVLLAALGTGPVPVAGAPTGGGLLASVPGTADPEAVLISITVGPDGDATWQVRYTFDLEDDNATAAFEDVAADIDADPATYRSRFADRMVDIADTAQSVTGRDMTVTNVTVEARMDPFTADRGFITYRFTWSAFGATEDGGLVIGDAIDGLFLTRNTTLTLSWPSTYSVATLRPAPDEREATAATWAGERNFGPGQPRVELTSSSEGDGTGISPETGGPLPVRSGTGLLALALVGVLTGVGVAWRWRTRLMELPGRIGIGVPWGSPGEGRPADDLLSNEERVVAVLERHGGRAKQQEIVEATGWSEVKTSEVVGELREKGVIEAFRLGRENVLSLPDEPDI